MTETLPRLLRSYEFLDLALAEHGSRMAAHETRRLRAERACVFTEIVAHPSRNARITMAQLRFIVQNLHFLAADPELLPAVAEMAARHLDDIELQLSTANRTSAGSGAAGGNFDAARFAPFDNLSDRIGIVGQDYRYIFTNASNARFHGESQSSFFDRPIWTMTGERFFERINRPRLDGCLLAGQSATCCCRNPKWASVLQLVTFDPLRDADGKIAGVVIVSRDVTHLPIPDALITTLEEE